LALISGWTGIDFSVYKPDQVLEHIHTNAIQSAVEAFSSADPEKRWTVQELADWVGIGITDAQAKDRKDQRRQLQLIDHRSKVVAQRANIHTAQAQRLQGHHGILRGQRSIDAAHQQAVKVARRVQLDASLPRPALNPRKVRQPDQK
jgi:hypothetical protein